MAKVRITFESFRISNDLPNWVELREDGDDNQFALAELDQFFLRYRELGREKTTEVSVKDCRIEKHGNDWGLHVVGRTRVFVTEANYVSVVAPSLGCFVRVMDKIAGGVFKRVLESPKAHELRNQEVVPQTSLSISESDPGNAT